MVLCMVGESGKYVLYHHRQVSPEKNDTISYLDEFPYYICYGMSK